jgi:ankyrin repeat protein
MQDGNTALHFAIGNAMSFHAVQVLINAGVQVDSANKVGKQV